MSDIDYSKARSALYNNERPHPDDVYAYKSEKSFDRYMRGNGLNPDNYKSGGNSGKSVSGGSQDRNWLDEDEGCFLTTACIKAKNLPDDCYELETLRKFRDTYMSDFESGREDIREYYVIAPGIVRAIDSLPNADEIWKCIYTDLVEYCIGLINSGKNREAYLYYKAFTLKLRQQFQQGE